jgi:hypothetical protein
MIPKLSEECNKIVYTIACESRRKTFCAQSTMRGIKRILSYWQVYRVGFDPIQASAFNLWFKRHENNCPNADQTLFRR